MAHAHLVACPGCARHLRVSEAHCPFCGHALESALRSRPAPVPPAVRLGRAALFAFGTSSVALASAACSSSSGPEVHSNVDAYGGPPAHPDASHSDAPTEDGSVRPDVFMGGALYGGSPVGEDAHRREEDTGVTADAFMGGALYGGSPIEEDSGVPMGGAAYGGTPDFDAGDK